jgi:hypothetical protein
MFHFVTAIFLILSQYLKHYLYAMQVHPLGDHFCSYNNLALKFLISDLVVFLYFF